MKIINVIGHDTGIDEGGVLFRVDPLGGLLGSWRIQWGTPFGSWRLRRSHLGDLILVGWINTPVPSSCVIELPASGPLTAGGEYVRTEYDMFKVMDARSINDTLYLVGLIPDSGQFRPAVQRRYTGGADAILFDPVDSWVDAHWVEVDQDLLLYLEKAQNDRLLVSMNRQLQIIDAARLSDDLQIQPVQINGQWYATRQLPGMNTAVIAFQGMLPQWSRYAVGSEGGRIIDLQNGALAYSTGTWVPDAFRITRFLPSPLFCDDTPVPFPILDTITITTEPVVITFGTFPTTFESIEVIVEDVPIPMEDNCSAIVGIAETSRSEKRISCGLDQASSTVWIHSAEPINGGSVEIINTLGQVVGSGSIHGDHSSYSIGYDRKLSAGAHVIRIIHDGKIKGHCRVAHSDGY